jgi:hypothetical protein
MLNNLVPTVTCLSGHSTTINIGKPNALCGIFNKLRGNMKKTIYTDFYRPEFKEDDMTSISNLFETIISKKIEDRNLDFGESTVRIQDCNKNSEGYYEGNFVKIRMLALPSRASLKGDLNQFDLEAYEGMGEEAAFLYDPILNILAMQRNRYSITTGTFSKYLKKKGENKNDVDFYPIITEDSLEKFKSMKTITKFQLKIAGISNPERFKNSGKAPGNVIDLLNEFGAPHMDLTISMGYSKNSMKLTSIQRAAKQFLQFSRKEKDNEMKSDVTSLIVSGNSEDGKPDFIDLVADRIIEFKEIEIKSTDRILPYNTRKIIVSEHFLKNLEQFNKRFK